MAAGAGLILWVLGGAVSAVNVLTPRARPDPPDVGLELISEVFYWSHPAWAIAAAVFAVAVYLGSGTWARRAGSPVLLPAACAVAAYAVTGGLAEALLVHRLDEQGMSFLDEVGAAVVTSVAVGLNGVFATSVALVAFWHLARATVSRSEATLPDRPRLDPEVADPTAVREILSG